DASGASAPLLPNRCNMIASALALLLLLLLRSRRQPLQAILSSVGRSVNRNHESPDSADRLGVAGLRRLVGGLGELGHAQAADRRRLHLGLPLHRIQEVLQRRLAAAGRAGKEGVLAPACDAERLGVAEP